MPHLVSNLFEKNFTPYTARLAPKNLWSRPTLGKCNSHTWTPLGDQATSVTLIQWLLRAALKWFRCVFIVCC